MAIVELQQRSYATAAGPGSGPVVVVRTAPALRERTRGLAWFLVIVGVTGLAGLAVLRVPAWVYVAYLVFFVVTALVVRSDAREGAARVQGEIAVQPGRLARLSGFEALGWEVLAIPSAGVVVLESIPEIDTKRIVGEMERACRVILVATADPIATFEAVRVVRKAPIGVVVLDQVEFDTARGVCEGLARALGWEMIDLTADPERRLPAEFDRPLSERAEALARAIGTDVPLPRPWGATAWTDATGTHLGLRNIGLLSVIVQVGLAVPVLGLLYLLSGGNLGIPLLGAALVVLRAGSRTIVDLTPAHVAVRPLTVWLPLDDERVLPWGRVEAVQAVTDHGNVGLRIVSDEGSAFVPTSSRAAARWAAIEVKRYLAERGRPC